MNRIRNFFAKNKVTIMLIPSAEKSIKQWQFNIAIAFLVLVGLIIINMTLLINTINSRVTSDSLTSENVELSQSLLMTQDKFEMLEHINSNKTDEINTLKLSLQSSNEFLVARLTEMEETQTYVTQLVTIFNTETKSTIEAPISRSFDRITETSSSAADLESDDEKLFSEIESLLTNDEISTIITEHSQAYAQLVTKLESQLNYLDSRPDFYPTNGTYSSPFGYRKDPVTGRMALHNGIDISNKVGTSIYAAGSGVVKFSGYDGNFGNVLIIDHGYGYESVYAHCKTLYFTAGDVVTKGEKIAIMGTSGRTTGPHLHFEIRYNKTPINPLKFIK